MLVREVEIGKGQLVAAIRLVLAGERDLEVLWNDLDADATPDSLCDNKENYGETASGYRRHELSLIELTMPVCDHRKQQLTNSVELRP